MFPVTCLLVGLNVAVFVVMSLSGVSPTAPHLDQLIRWGADFGPLTLQGQWWRLFSSMFLHIGVVHILLNMWCLWSLGRLAEPLFGKWFYIGIYFISGLAADVFSLAWAPLRISAGASGAIFGIAGALITGLYFGNLTVSRSELKGTIKSVVLFAFYNLVFGLRSGVDNMAHLGGLAAGLILGLSLARVLRPTDERRQAVGGFTFGAALILLGVSAAWVQRARADVIQLYQGKQLLDQGQFAAAIPKLRLAAAANPNDMFLQSLLGVAYEDNGQLAEAEAAYKSALRLNPHDQYVVTRLGEVYLGQERYQQAFERVRNEVQPSSAGDLHLVFGRALLAQGSLNQALAELGLAVKRDSKNPESYRFLGNADMVGKSYAAAVTAYQEWVKLAPQDADAHRALAIALQADGKTIAAHKELNQAQALVSR